jgi:hypothetical protein
MNRDQTVEAAALARELTARSARMPGSVPVADLARRAAAAWRTAHDSAPGPARQLERATVAVVGEVYRVGVTAGRHGGAEAVAGHIAAAGTWMAGQLGDGSDPDNVVRELLGRLVAAAHKETLLSSVRAPAGVADTPLPRTYIDAYGDGRDRTDLQRAATATTVAWTHGYQDGWKEAFWSANRIINTIRHDELVATTAIDGTPTLAWLDELAESARRIADRPPDRPGDHPARLARLAGSSVPPSAIDAPEAPSKGGPSAPTHHTDATDKDNRRPRGM